jgi:DNA polymerase bacteriophage-type
LVPYFFRIDAVPTLFRDFETRSTLDLRDVGAWRYSRDPTTDVWCCGYVVDDEPVKLWVPGDPVPLEFIEAAQNPDWLVCAFNDNFERQIEAHVMVNYGWPVVSIERHRCLQAAALALALPAKLETVAQVLKLEHQKDQAGHAVMIRMAKPRRPRKDEDPTGTYWVDDPDRRQQLYRYCKQDVAVERELHHRIAGLIPAEQSLWQLDARINDRGIHIDGDLLDAATRIADATQREIVEEFKTLTELDSIDQKEKLIAWLAAHDSVVTDLQKPTLKKALARNGIPAKARRAIELRLDGAHANKFATMRAWCNGDARVRGVFRFHGAHTGRWTSLGIQLQNLKRPVVKDMAAAIAVVATGDLNHVRQHYPQPMSVVGDITRALISAPKGRRLIAADLSGIESRVVAWLSGQQSKLDLWKKFDRTQDLNDDPYFVLGRQSGIAQERAREIGKTADLAFGYGGSIGAWRKLAGDGDTSTDEQIRKYQGAWRRAHPQIVRFWGAIDRSAVRAVQTPGQTFALKHVSFIYEGDFLFMLLPSGRRFAYPFPRLVTNGYGNSAVIFKINDKGKWTDCRHGQGMWGGVWTENVVQAVARDLFAAAMMRLEDAGYPIVLHVHDEIVAECPDGFGSSEEFLKLITTLPDWAEGRPIAAKVREGQRFCKIKAQEKPEPPEPPDAPPPDAPDEAERTEPPAGEPREQDMAQEQPRTNGYGAHNNEFHDYPSGEEERGQRAACYIYKDERGEEYQKVTRMMSPKGKTFPQAWRVNWQWVTKKPAGWVNIPYRLLELIAARPDEAIWICEGEKDADNVAALGLIATTNPEGAGKWTTDLNKWFVGKKRVNILEDNDPAGRAHAAKVAAAMHGVGVPNIRIVLFPELKEHGDVSDWLAQGHGKDDLFARADAAPKFDGSSALKSARASTYKKTAVQWIWPGRFAIGKLGIIAGLPDEGKGQVLCDVAARVTRGSLWPCNEGHALQGNVVLLTAEDDIEDTVVPRLEAAHADLKCIEIARMVREQGKDRMFSLVTDLELLRQKVIEVGSVRMVQIDPISAALKSSSKTYSAAAPSPRWTSKRPQRLKVFQNEPSIAPKPISKSPPRRMAR